MIWSAQRFKQSWALFPKVLSQIALALLPLSIVLWLMEYAVSSIHKSRFITPHESSVTFIILFGLGAFILESLISVAWLILVAHSTQNALRGEPAKSTAFLIKNFHQTLIEYVRAMISVGLYALMLIIPGVIRWIDLTFACFVSLFSEPYHLGKVDALDQSKKLVKGYFFPLLLLVITLSIIPVIFEKLAWSLGANFLSIGIFYLLSWLSTVLLAIYITLTYFALADLKST